MIKLIMNADDFGHSKVFNQKILDLLERGFIHSTTVMVNRVTHEQSGQIERLVQLSKSKDISIGIHLEFDVDSPIPPQIQAQYDRFLLLFKFGPSHLDFHYPKTTGKSIEPYLNTIAIGIDAFALEHGLKVRNTLKDFKHEPITTTEKVLTGTYLSYDKLANLIEGLRDGESYELVFHPGDYDPNSKSSLNRERRDDYENIVRLQALLAKHTNIKNISYNDLAQIKVKKW